MWKELLWFQIGATERKKFKNPDFNKEFVLKKSDNTGLGDILMQKNKEGY